MRATASYRWAPIEDLPTGHERLAKPELRALEAVWSEQHGLLAQSEGLRVFLERLQREWAIETGVIERVYTLDRGITQLLIERGVDASLIPHGATDKNPELVASIIRDHETAIEGLFDFVKGGRKLSVGYIKELHAVMTRHQDASLARDTLGRELHIELERGEYKRLPNNPVRDNGSFHEYCPPEQVSVEMERLLTLHENHERENIPVEVESAWFHHRFTLIHPFQDGNGRVVRALVSLLFIKAGWFPLVITRDQREAYIDALEVADRGDLQDLVNLFASVEKRAFINALGIAGEVQRRERVDQVVAAARDTIEKRQKLIRREWEQAKATARLLQEVANDRLGELEKRMKREIGPLFKSDFFVNSEGSHGSRNYYFRRQILETGKALGYVVNTGVYSAWTRFVLKTQSQAEVLLSFHGIGHEFRGILAASMCYYRREQTEQKEREITDITPVSTEIFQINYRESFEDAKVRFEEWLEHSLIRGLEIWRSTL